MQVSCTRNSQVIKKQQQTMQTTKRQIVRSLQTILPSTFINFVHVSASLLHKIEI